MIKLLERSALACMLFSVAFKKAAATTNSEPLEIWFVGFFVLGATEDRERKENCSTLHFPSSILSLALLFHARRD